ncbi:MAG: hypothetical protein H6667_19515 [Ardenticatenaceae bacterium]|nr:hypothetical protein [Ardenticatenaceae bacterium]
MWIQNRFPVVAASLLLAMSLAACSAQPDEIITVSDMEETAVHSADWTTESHSNEVEPNYDVAFPDDRVNQLTIAPED